MLCGLENMYSCAGRSSNSRMLLDSQTSGAYRSIFYICVYVYAYIYVYFYNNYYYCIILDSAVSV